MVDETGHSGDAGAAEGGAGAESRDRTLLNGWAARESPWSNAGAALDPEAEVPAWRRPATEVRPFTRPLPTDPPSGDIRPFAAAPPPPSFTPAQQSPAPPADGSPPRLENAASPRWSDSRSRYDDLLSHLSPNGGEPHQDEPRAAEPPRAAPLSPVLPPRTAPLSPVPPPRPDPLSPELLHGGQEGNELRGVPPTLPASAPPYPYEGDLDDAARPQAAQQRASFPAVRPATPGGRRTEWTTAESARHALDPPTPAEGMPRVGTPEATDQSRSGDQGLGRPSYDPSSFPRRLPYESPQPAFPGRPAGDPGAGTTGKPPFAALPQRVPAQPDVPTVPEPPSVEPSAETPALARIATHLRREDALAPQERQDGFDVNAILEAVREVEGVRDAALRTTPAGAHSLRLDLAEGADPAEVSRQVARLLQDRMGLDAAMQGASPLAPARTPEEAPPAPAPRSAPPAQATTRALPTRTSSAAQASAPPVAPAPFVPSQPNPAGRATPPGAATMPAPATSPGPAPMPAPAPMASPPAAQRMPTGIDPAPPRPLLEPGERPGPRVMIENVQVNTFGSEATVRVQLTVGGQAAAGEATGPAVDGYLLRLCAMATATAVDDLLTHSDHADGPAKCFVEHAAAVPFGSIQVAVVVVLLATDGWVEQLAGSAVVTGDDRHAMVRATLAAVNRRLEALLS
ncbi:Daple [Couchioplanes caeruleus]|uniref:Daple n=1 Tax=Couchioplanes caeruleus TaxID=56438 RepID=UPI0020BDA4BC|nr:Daple [Couchioplanes caeruleus]UQU64238.1 Daple [Couchioplanes caeruleus]